jgi:glycosyltransferase involved in cell wall biosynthesis
MVRKTARLRRYLKREKPDVMISFMTRCNAMALAASIGLRCGIIISERNDPRYRPEPLVDRAIRALLYRHSDLLVAQTSVLEEVSRTLFHVARTACIPNPFLPVLATKASAVECTGADRPYALAMGRLYYQKGFDVLIRAFAQSAERHVLNLVIAGEGEEREPLATLAHELGIADRVRFVGHVDQPSSLLAGCGIFILSSRYEGFPNVVLEAMSFGRPVISTRLPSGAHAIIEDGVSGLLVPTEDVDSLAHAISRIATDGALAARLGTNGRKAIEPFGLEPVIAQWREVIEKVAA